MHVMRNIGERKKPVSRILNLSSGFPPIPACVNLFYNFRLFDCVFSSTFVFSFRMLKLLLACRHESARPMVLIFAPSNHFIFFYHSHHRSFHLKKRLIVFQLRSDAGFWQTLSKRLPSGVIFLCSWLNARQFVLLKL